MAWARTLRTSPLHLAQNLGQEPRSALGLVDPGFNQARGGDIIIPVADLMSGAKKPCQLHVVVPDLRQHLLRRNTLIVVQMSP